MGRRVTGIFVRVKEDGVWVNKDLALCDAEQIRYALRNWTEEDRINCIVHLCETLTDVDKAVGDMIRELHEGIASIPVDKYPIRNGNYPRKRQIKNGNYPNKRGEQDAVGSSVADAGLDRVSGKRV